MLYRDFHGKKISRLGFGAMRLPLSESGEIDEAQVNAMVDAAIAGGVNYFDTAYPYHGGKSEIVLGKALSRYPREQYYLADKYPGHQVSERYDPKEVFENQLRRCKVEYFDFYLMHNVYENSIDVYLDPKWGIMDYFLEQKRLGRIRHLGFSTHGGLDVMRRFLDLYGKELDFCQIQLNYLDWTLQNAEGKCALLKEYGIPVWVMEPVHGGKLANLSEGDAAKLCALRPEATPAEWAFRYVQGMEDVGVILSGMSSMAQMEENIRTFAAEKPLNAAEAAALAEIAEGMKDSLPCTACRYCCDGCPMGLDIPMLLSIENELRVAPSTNTSMRIEFMPEEKRPSACIGCGQCAHICPQKIDIPEALRDLTKRLAALPSWAKISREREEIQKKLAEEQQ